MSNNSFNHNTPGNSGNDDPGHSSHDSPGSSNNDDPGPSSHDLPGSSNNDDPGPSSHDSPGSSNYDNPEEPEVPFVSRYGMAHAMNSLQDVELYRATLFNLKTEPIEDRERRSEEANRLFLQQCREQEDEQTGDLLPEETNTEIKSEPIDEVEENTSFSYMETEPLDYLPESYSESMENSSHIDANHSRANVFEGAGMYLQQITDLEEEMDERYNLSPENSSYIYETGPRANEFEGAGMHLQQFTDSEEEMDETDNYIQIVVPPVLPVPLEPEEINERNTQLVVPEAIVLSNTMTETPPPIDTITNPRANDCESNGMCLQQLRESEEEMNEIDHLSTENSSYTDEINTMEYEMQGSRTCLQQLRDSEEEMDETDNNIQLVVPPVLPVPLEPEEINERNTQLVVPEAIVLSNTMTETPPPIDTITNPRANDCESNGMCLQQLRESEEEMNEIDHLSTENSSYTDEINTMEYEMQGSRTCLQQLRDSEEEMDETDNNIQLVVPPVLPVPLEPEEINERNTQLVVPEAIVLSNTMTDTAPPIDTITNPRANECESNEMFLQKLRDLEEEMDETDNNIQLVVPPVLPVPLEPEEINERNTQLVVPEAIVLLNTMTETPPPIDTITNPRENEFESTEIFLQQLRDSEEETEEIDNLSPENSSYIDETGPRANEFEGAGMHLQQFTDSEEELNEIDNLSTENSSYTDEINSIEYEMQGSRMCLQQLRDSEEEMDETDNNIQLVVPPVLPVPLEPEEINERNTQLVVPEAIVLSNTMTETPPPIDTITNPRANEFESTEMFLQQLRDSEEEMDETDNNIQIVVPPVLPVPLEPEEINERNTQLVVPEAIVLSNTMTETPPPIDTITNPRANEFESTEMFLQQLRDSEEELNEIDNLSTENSSYTDETGPRANEFEGAGMHLQQFTDSEEELNEIDNLSTENSSNTVEINTIEYEMQGSRMCLQQLRDSEEEMDETDNNIQLVVPPVLPVPLEPEEINGRNTQLVVPEAIVLSNTMTETPPPIDTITNPRANEFESTEMFLQQLRDSEEEMDETDNNIQIVVPPVLPVPLEPEEINERNTQLVVPEAIVLSNTMTETPHPIDTITNPRASDLNNGITNTIENPASVQRRTRKKKYVNLTPTRVSTRIKKPRIMYNI